MSLDFYLYDSVETEKPCICPHCDNQHIHQYKECLFHQNITHNLTNMADASGCYNCLWRPEENGYRYAKDIIDILKTSIESLNDRPELFKKLNPSNGWGSFEGFKQAVHCILDACENNPNAEIKVSA